MDQKNILDESIIKNLSNHIYEKRKATAFQIESLTKSALNRNDSQTIYKIINELSELTNGGTSSARMGAITALGSVSVALGSFAIAYFLDQIIKPIFSTFRDTDARVRYYACESLYNIAKIARGEILLYLNEIFDVLCVLVTDSESSVKNAADILDRLIKDIVSAKATNYVSILQQHDTKDADGNDIISHVVNEDGTATQVNNPQDTQKAFSLPKFMPTLLERMYTIDPFAKKFLISWLELFNDIPSLEPITFLPNVLDPLIKFLRNNSPSDVRIETQNLLNVFLKEVKAISKVKFEIKKKKLIEERKTKAAKTDEAAENPQSESDETKLSQKLENAGIDDKEDNENDSILSEEISVIRHETSDKTPVNESHIEDEEEFYEGQNVFIDFHKIIGILLSFLNDEKQNELSGDTHEIALEVQFIVLKWLQEIIQFSPLSFTNYFPECIASTLKNIAAADSKKDFDLRNQYLKFNLALQGLFMRLNESKQLAEHKAAEAEINLEDSTSTLEITPLVQDNEVLGLSKEVYEEFIELHLLKALNIIMSECLTCGNELARITSLDWLIFLYSREPSTFVNVDGDGDLFDFTALLKSATDSSNEVISKVLQLLSKISETNQDFFKDFMVKIVEFFENDLKENNAETLSTRNGIQNSSRRNKVEFTIRKLCVTLDSEKIFKTLSEVLASTDNFNLDFLNMMIITLNNILLTTPELATFRKKLKNLDVYKLDDWNLFSTLFQSWSHNPASALSLCLLTSNYDLAFLIIKALSEMEITFQLLTQLDILVQLLESPIFLKLRLQLLEPEKHAYLYKILYGLLMILPQSSTFTTLHNRLSSVSSINSLVPPNVGILSTPVSTPHVPSGGGTTSSTNQQLSIKRKKVYELLEKFNAVQERHENFGLEKKLKESGTSLYTQNEDISFRLNQGRSTDSQGKSDRLLSYGSEKKDYFGVDSGTESAGKRIGSGKLLQRFNGK